MQTEEERRAHKAAYQAAHREKLRQYMRAWQAAHRENCRANANAYYAAHPERCRASADAWKAAHPEKGRIYAATSRARRKDYARTYQVTYRAACPDKYREANRKRNALRRQIREVEPEQVLIRDEWRKILLLSGGKCYWCRKKMKKPTQDHVIPLSKGGLHVAANIVAACQSCNSKKGAKCITLL